MKLTRQSVLAGATLVIGGLLGASALVAMAQAVPGWNPPSQTPPNGNVAAPINVGPNKALINIPGVQEKTDSMIIDGGLSILGNLQIFTGASTTPGAVLVNDGTGVASWSEANQVNGSPTYVGTAQELPNPTQSKTAGAQMNLPDYTNYFTVMINATYFTCLDYPVTLLVDGINIGHYSGRNGDSGGCDQNTVTGLATLSPGAHTLQLSSDNGQAIIGETHYSWVAGTDIGITDNINVPLASVSVSTDEQVLIHVKGTSVTATNWTRNGGSIKSYSFLDSVNGLPVDGRPLKITNLLSNNNYAQTIYPCPVGYTPTSNPGYALSNEACIYQQPNSTNGYEAIVAIWDGSGGSHTWKFGLDYQKLGI